MAFEWKNYPKYDMTLGEYYARKQSIIVPRDDKGTPLDSITFTDVEGNEVSYSTKEIENVALNRHGNKRMLYMPDWFANNYNNNESPEFPYSGSSKTDYVELYNLYYTNQLFPSWWNKSTQENFNRIFQSREWQECISVGMHFHYVHADKNSARIINIFRTDIIICIYD